MATRFNGGLRCPADPLSSLSTPLWQGHLALSASSHDKSLEPLLYGHSPPDLATCARLSISEHSPRSRLRWARRSNIIPAQYREPWVMTYHGGGDECGTTAWCRGPPASAPDV